MFLLSLFSWANGGDPFVRVSAEWAFPTGFGGFREDEILALPPLMGLTGIVPLMSAGFLHVVRWSDDSGDAQKLPSWSKIVLATWCVGFIALTMFMVLMIYNRSVYGGPIIGVQGRYFVYMVPIAVLALPQPKWLTVDRSKAGDLGTGMMLSACLLACMVIVTPGLVY